MKVEKIPADRRLNILLTNGRFPTTLDLARQLHKVGHTIYVIDPMKYHICKFSFAVKKSFIAPAPHDNASGYIKGVKKAVQEAKIDLIIPMHEEVFFLSQYEDLQKIMFAPAYHTLISMHNKWEFYKLVKAIGEATPETQLVLSMDDVRKLDLDNKEYALKPVFGRAKSGIYHLKPNEPLPEADIGEHNQYIAQEWIKGKEMCSYAVCRDGEVKAISIYPVIDTIDGSSCVYFESIEHQGVKSFIENFARAYHITGQLAFDYVEANGELYVFECNPRATSGIHLFKHTNWLSEAFTNPSAQRHDAVIGARRQMLAGMAMWEHGDAKLKQRSQHVGRLMSTRDVTFGKSDPGPALMQPFLGVQYKRLCKQKNLQLKELFQWDMLWEPTRKELEKAKEQREEQRMNDTTKNEQLAMEQVAA